jgi:hypothetical protein
MKSIPISRRKRAIICIYLLILKEFDANMAAFNKGMELAGH